MTGVPRNFQARIAMLCAAIAGPARAARAEAFSLPSGSTLRVRHGTHGAQLTLIGEGLHTDVTWRQGGPAARLHALCAGREPNLWPDGVPLELLLPDMRSLEAQCSCQERSPCVHELAALYAFATWAEGSPEVLCRDGELPISDLPPRWQSTGERPKDPPPVGVGEAFWSYLPGPPGPSQTQTDLFSFSDGDPFHDALLETMRSVRRARWP